MSLCDAFFSDALCDLLSHGDKKAVLVKALFSELLDRAGNLELIDFGMHFPPQTIEDNLERVRNLCKCFLSLLDPRDEGPGNMEHVAAVKSSSSNDHMEATARTLLTNGGFWCLKAEEQAKKAATSHTAKPLLRELTQKLTAEDTEVSMDDVKMCIEKLPELREKLRDGATSCIEPVLLKELKKQASGLLVKGEQDEGQDAAFPQIFGQPVSSQSLATLVFGLSLFTSEKGVPAMIHKLDEYRKESKTSLGVAGLVEALRRHAFRLDASEEDIQRIDIAAIARLMEDMGGFPSPLPSELTSACTLALPSLLACLRARAARQFVMKI